MRLSRTVFALALVLLSASSGAAPYLLCPEDTLRVYTRPSEESAQFGLVVGGDSLMICARAEGGWLGFQPGIAQAGNVGPFRLRWLRPHDSEMLDSTALAGLQLIEPLLPRAVYLMAYDTVPVMSGPDVESQELGMVPPEGWALVEARTSPGDWVLLRGRDRIPSGWVRLVAAGLNGRLDTLPEIALDREGLK